MQNTKKEAIVALRGSLGQKNINHTGNHRNASLENGKAYFLCILSANQIKWFIGKAKFSMKPHALK